MSSSWNKGRWQRHDARSSDSYRDDDYNADLFIFEYKEKKKQAARREGKRLRRMEQLEQESRKKTVDPKYDSATKICRFFSVGKCAHCTGDHYGLPFQNGVIADESGQLTQVPCPLQEQFQYSYGKKAMVEMITNSNVRCKYPVAEVNGLQIACNGKHPTHIHDEVIDRLEKQDKEGEEVTIPKCANWDMVKRIHMSELPILDSEGHPLCAHKTNDPVNELCLLRVDEAGDHLCGSQAHFTISNLRKAQPHDLNSLARELQLLFLKCAPLEKRAAYFQQCFSKRYDAEAADALSMHKEETSFTPENSCLADKSDKGTSSKSSWSQDKSSYPDDWQSGSKGWKDKAQKKKAWEDETSDEAPEMGQGFRNYNKQGSGSWGGSGHDPSAWMRSKSVTLRGQDGSYIRHDGKSGLTLTSPRNQGDASRRGRSSDKGHRNWDYGDSSRARSHGAAPRNRSRTVDRYTPLGSYGILVFKLNYNSDGSLKKFEEHEVLLARKGGRDTFRKKAKQAEGPKGHRRDDDPKRDTPVKTATYHALHEAGWSTHRDFTKPGNHAVIRLYDGPGSRRTGQVVAGVASIDEIPKLQSEMTHRREGSAMIAVVHDKATDHLGSPKDRSYDDAKWYVVQDVIDQCWGHQDSWNTGDVKGYWKDFLENMSKENIFKGNTKGQPFAFGKTTLGQQRPLTPEPADQRQKLKQTPANLGGIDSHVLHRLGNFASPALFHLVRLLHDHVGLDGSMWLTDLQSAVQNDQDQESVRVRKLFQHTSDPRDPTKVESVGIHDFVKKAFSRSSEHPILEAPKESELGLSDTSNQVKINFSPSILLEWETANHRRFDNDPACFLEAKCYEWGLEDLNLPDGLTEEDIDWEKQAKVHNTATMEIESALMLNTEGLCLLSVNPRIYAIYGGDIMIDLPCVLWDAQRHPDYPKGKSGQIILVSAEEAREIRTGRKRVSPTPKSEPTRPGATLNPKNKADSKDRPAPSKSELPLPSGWRMARDTTTGKAYYWHVENQVAQWTHPDEARPSPTKRPPEGDIEEPPLSKIKQELDQVSGLHSQHCQSEEFQYLVRFQLPGHEEDDVEDLNLCVEGTLQELDIVAQSSVPTHDAPDGMTPSRDVAFKTQEDLDTFVKHFDADFTVTGLSLTVMRKHWISSLRASHRFFSYHVGKRLYEMRRSIPPEEGFDNTLVATVLDAVKGYRTKNYDFQFKLVDYFEKGQCTQFVVPPIRVDSIRSGQSRDLTPLNEQGKSCGIVILSIEDSTHFIHDVWNDKIDGTRVRFEKANKDKSRQVFGSRGKHYFPRDDEDDADEEGKEKKDREETGKRQSSKRTPKSSGASGPKKSGASSCKEKKRTSQRVDGGLVEEIEIGNAGAEDRVDTDPEPTGHDLSDGVDTGGDRSASSMFIMEDGKFIFGLVEKVGPRPISPEDEEPPAPVFGKAGLAGEGTTASRKREAEVRCKSSGDTIQAPTHLEQLASTQPEEPVEEMAGQAALSKDQRDQREQIDGDAEEKQEKSEKLLSSTSRAETSNDSSSSNDSNGFLAGLEALDLSFKAAELRAGGKAGRKVREEFTSQVFAMAKPEHSLERLGGVLKTVTKDLQRPGITAAQVREICQPISNGPVPLEWDCTAPRSSSEDKGIRSEDGSESKTKSADRALQVELERNGKELRVKLDVPESLAHAPSSRQEEVLKTVQGISAAQGLSMGMVSRSTALTSEALKSFSLRIAEDGGGKTLDRARGTAAVIDENIPDAYFEDDKSIMGFPSVSEVGAALALNMVGTGSGHESLISDVQELVTSLTQLLEKATELTEDSGEDDSTVPQALASFAEETHSKLNSLVASSFQVLEENDPRPHAKQVQKEELCKAIKKEVQIRGSTDYFSIGSDAGASVVTELVGAHVACIDLISDSEEEETKEPDVASQSFTLPVAATPACLSEVDSDVSSTISEDGPFDHHGADACSVASSDGGSSTASTTGSLKCTKCKERKDVMDLAFICCQHYRECKTCALARGVQVERVEGMTCGKCKKAKAEKKLKKRLESISSAVALDSIAEESTTTPSIAASALPTATSAPQTYAPSAAMPATPVTPDVHDKPKARCADCQSEFTPVTCRVDPTKLTEFCQGCRPFRTPSPPDRGDQEERNPQEGQNPKISNMQVRSYRNEELIPLAVEEEGGPPLRRPCVDCGLYTGRYCDGSEFHELGFGGFACFARDRLPSGDSEHREWNEGQRTPLCSTCDNKRGACHFCFGVPWVLPFPHESRTLMAEYVLAAKAKATAVVVDAEIRAAAAESRLYQRPIAEITPTEGDSEAISTTDAKDAQDDVEDINSVSSQSDQLEPHAARPALSAISATSSEGAPELSSLAEAVVSDDKCPICGGRHPECFQCPNLQSSVRNLPTKEQWIITHAKVRDRPCLKCKSKLFKGERKDDPNAVYCSEVCQLFSEKASVDLRPLRPSRKDYKVQPIANCARCDKEVYAEAVVCDGLDGSEIFCSPLCQHLAEKGKSSSFQNAESAVQGPRPIGFWMRRSKDDSVKRPSPPPYTVTPGRLNADCDLNVKPTEVVACEVKTNSKEGPVQEEESQRDGKEEARWEPDRGLVVTFKELLEYYGKGQGFSEAEVIDYWNEDCVRIDQWWRDQGKTITTLPVRVDCDASSDGADSWIVTSMSEVTSSRKPGDYQFDDAVHVPLGSESPSTVSAQSGQVDDKRDANPIVAAVKAAADVITEVAGPATKVMALASAHMAEGAYTHSLQMSLSTNASPEKVLALLLSTGVILGLGYYGLMVLKPTGRDKAIKEAERLLQVSRASTSFKLNSSKKKKVEATSSTISSESQEDPWDQWNPTSWNPSGKPWYSDQDSEQVNDQKTPASVRSPPQQKKKKVPFKSEPFLIDPEWQPPIAPFATKCQVPCQECSERTKRDTSGNRATSQPIPACGLEHEHSLSFRAKELLWHVCPFCCSQGTRNPNDPAGQAIGLLLDLHNFKTKINEQIGQEARIVIKKSVQRVDPEWLITILRTMKLKRYFGKIHNPWNAFQSAFAEPPFDIYAMTRGQVAMLYHTMKDHLVRHVDALTARPTDSLWDYVPEPRLQVARPFVNDARAGVGNMENQFASEACFVCNVFGPCPCTHPANPGVVDPVNDGRGDSDDALRCLGCGRFMHQDDVYPCMECHATPFHLECLEPHYGRVHPRPEHADEEEKRTKEEEILQQEADDARSQWVNHMTNLSRLAMPFGRRSFRIASIAVALVSVGLSTESFWAMTSADIPLPLLQ